MDPLGVYICISRDTRRGPRPLTRYHQRKSISHSKTKPPHHQFEFKCAALRLAPESYYFNFGSKAPHLTQSNQHIHNAIRHTTTINRRNASPRPARIASTPSLRPSARAHDKSKLVLQFLELSGDSLLLNLYLYPLSLMLILVLK